MYAKVSCLVISCLALASAGLVPLHQINILEGPSTRTKVVGPDGSIIDAFAPGGKIYLDQHTVPLIQPAPVVLAHAAIAEPHYYSPVELKQVFYAEPVSNLVQAAEPVQAVQQDDADSVVINSKISQAAEPVQAVQQDDADSVVVNAKIAQGAEPVEAVHQDEADSVVISRASEDDEKVFLHPGTEARVENRSAVPITEETDETVGTTEQSVTTTEEGTTATADLSGTYVPDNYEKLFDDGSYRSEHF